MQFKQSWYLPTFKTLADFFKGQYFDPLLVLMSDPIYTNSINDITSGIKAGRIRISGNVITGTFSARVSKSLSQFATFDRRAKTWKVTGKIPGEIKTASFNASVKLERLIQQINQELDRIQKELPGIIDTLTYPMDSVIDDMARAYDSDVMDFSLYPDVTPAWRERINREYTRNMNHWVKNWNEEQILRLRRLREMAEKNVEIGMNRRILSEQIQAEWGVSARKANFLARQETTLLSSAIRDERYIGAGVEFYIWDNAGDIRVVGNPAGPYEPSKGHGNHWEIDGKICSMKNPDVYADTLADAVSGRWKPKSLIGADNVHPGVAFLCRCTSRPIPPGTY